MGMKEGFNIEYKREASKTFLKTVSAYSNYNDGKIIFGIDDNGDSIGIENVDEECLRIENMINDSMDPSPDFYINIENIDNKSIIVLNVRKGRDTPYFYNGKAYKRSDTSTIEVDRFELKRLAIEGLNMNYEERKASLQNLEFGVLESKLIERTGIEKINLDILRTLNLYNKDGYYNFAAELLSDNNSLEFSGVDIVRFGKDINQILYRETLTKTSLLSQYDRAIEIFEQYYQYEEIEGFNRVKIELIPKEAFRESLANAIVHRVWDVNSNIQIYMFEDRIEVISPGGLPDGISKEEYLYGNISVLRNPIIAGIFYRLNIIEKFGTGIIRINNEYNNSISKPSFDISINSINIVLPVMKTGIYELSNEEEIVFKILKEETEVSRAELEEKSGFNKSKTLRLINSLVDKGIIQKQGNGPSTTYKL